MYILTIIVTYFFCQFAAPDGSQKQQLCLVFPWYSYEREKLCGLKLHKVKIKDDESVGALEPR